MFPKVQRAHARSPLSVLARPGSVRFGSLFKGVRGPWPGCQTVEVLT